MKLSVYFAMFPFGNQQVPDVTDWLIQTVSKCRTDPRIDQIWNLPYDDTPITMTRNRAVKDAKRVGADLLLMIDSDMDPDIGTRKPRECGYAGAKPFWDVALEFLINHSGPAIIAAPYCGPPPHENVYVFRPAKFQSDHPNADIRIEQYPREEAAQRGGIEECFALPTGLMLIDMRAFDEMPDPKFAYGYADKEQSEKDTTEDVYFSRNCALIGVKQFVAWDCWAGHWKRKRVGRPTLLTMDSVREEYRAAIVRGQVRDERLVMIGEGRSNLNAPKKS